MLKKSLQIILVCFAGLYASQQGKLEAPRLYLPEDGTQIGKIEGPQVLSLIWVGVKSAMRYRVQVCKNANCTVARADTKVQDYSNTSLPHYVLSDLPNNEAIYWRVCSIDSAGNQGAWSAVRKIVLGYPERAGLMVPLAITDEHVLGVVSMGPRKDTRMLCLDWNTYQPGCELNNVVHPWNGSHTAAAHYCEHESWGCWIVGAEMLNHFRGHTVTFDELKYHEFGNGPAENDFPHGMGGGGYPNQCEDVASWALSISVAELNESYTMPTEAQIRSFIGAGRPIYWCTGGHVMILDGFHLNGTTFEVHMLNNDNDGNVYWAVLSTLAFSFYFCPNAGTSGRNVDALVNTDSDGDGVVNFDESNRFGTDPNNPDTDKDGIPDMTDIFSYSVARNPPINPDIDGDGLRAERDYDSDNGGKPDGYEDRNCNGVKEADETDVFSASDDGTIPANLTLTNMTISSKQTYLARNSISVAPSVTINNPADVIFAAGNIVNLNAGLSQNLNTLVKVRVDPNLR